MSSKNKETEMLGVIFDRDEDLKPKVDSDHSSFYIPYFKDAEYFGVYDNEITFIKGVEALVRSHSFYSKYIKYLIEIVGIKQCQVLGNIEIPDANSKKSVTFEMHHGPILTLFDICMIVNNYLRYQGEEHITTFKVANMVIEEHRLNNVHTVLVTKSVHQQIHEGNVSINYNQGFGDTATFLEKYKEGITDDIKGKINKYIEWSENNDSYDNDIFAISQKLKRWGNNDFPN